MGWLSLVGAGVSMLGNAQAGLANLKQNEYSAGMLENQAYINTELDLIRGRDIYEETADALDNLWTQGRETVGQQKAAMAAQGLTSDSKTMQDLINDTFTSIAKDENALLLNRDRAVERNRTNTLLENLNLKSQAQLYRMAGKNAVSAAGLQSLGQGISSMGQFYANNYQRNSLYK